MSSVIGKLPPVSLSNVPVQGCHPSPSNLKRSFPGLFAIGESAPVVLRLDHSRTLRQSLTAPAGAVGLLLLIACATVANLVL
jgi:hypothetical protein